MQPSDPTPPAAAFEPAALADPASKKPRACPPVGRRWQPGQSGNPAGRPRRQTLPSAPAALERALKGRVTVQTGGRPRRLGVTEAVIEAMIDRALAGDTAARRDLMEAQAELEAAARERREAAREAREAKARAQEKAARAAAEAAQAPAHDCGRYLRGALALLGAGTEHAEYTAYGGRRQQGKVTLDSWVVEAALARDPGLIDRWDGEQCATVLRAMNGAYCGMFERHGERFAPAEVVAETAVMARLLARVREYWRGRGELFV